MARAGAAATPAAEAVEALVVVEDSQPASMGMAVTSVMGVVVVVVVGVMVVGVMVVLVGVMVVLAGVMVMVVGVMVVGVMVVGVMVVRCWAEINLGGAWAEYMGGA